MNALVAPLASALSRGWWLLLLRGLAAVAFGVLTFLRPDLSLVALVLVFGAYALADGVLAVWAAFSGPLQDDYGWILLLEGLLGIGIGALTLFAPEVTAVALLFYIAAWAIATGVLEIAAAIRLRKVLSKDWLLLLCGVLSVGFGAILLARPGAGALSVVWLIGAYALAFGIVMLVLAFKLRAFVHRLTG